jgi:hypothetical protein
MSEINNTEFEELFLEENFEKLNKLCMKYASMINQNKANNVPSLPSVMAAELGLTLQEFNELVNYFNELYEDELRERVISDMERGQKIDWEKY